jgi:hypothetical protein
MEENLSNEKIDKIMFRYFDDKFNGATYEEEVAVESMDRWDGFFIGDVMLVGHPSDDDSDLWFSNGPIFGHGTEILGISTSAYCKSMVRYIHKKYPDVRIDRII